MRHRLLFAVLLLSAFSFTDAPAGPSWTGDGVIVCVRARTQDELDGVAIAGGAVLFAWRDFRSGIDRDIYFQAVESTGAARWGMYGLPICVAAGDQEEPIVVADGAGGAIVVWTDNRGGDADIYAQRIDETGAALWTTDGVAVCDLPVSVYGPSAASDGDGGVIVAWSDQRRGYEIDLWAQRISPGGALLWGPDGAAVCVDTMAQYDGVVAPDGAGGAWIAWRDARRRASIRDAPHDLYAVRVFSDGSAGVECLVGDEAVENYNPAIAADGLGNAILVWEDRPIEGDVVLRTQKLLPGNLVGWEDTALVVASRPHDQVLPLICADGAGGAAIVWSENNGADIDLYAQRIDADGARLWGDGGVPVCTAAGSQSNASICPDDSGGVVVAWHDDRGGPLAEDIYAQRIDGAGSARWPAAGAGVCTRSERSLFPAAVATGAGQTVVGWQDSRYDGYFDIFAQLVEADGEIVATALRGFDATVDGEGIIVSWRVSTDIRPVFAAERRLDGGAWRPLDVSIEEDGPGAYRFRDEPPVGRSAAYRVSVDDGDGSRTLFETDRIGMPAPPLSLVCAPNPFNPSTIAAFSLPNRASIVLVIHDAAGRRVRTLARGPYPAGKHAVSWNGLDDRGVPAVSGVYLCRLRAGKETVSTKMVLLR
ncbi:MAG: T9SS type A sorting domain-containing protein [Candidatus Krumholzibacteriota bacterium]|nr:T9SS type A sorting domain-containing protein [Candidatus Krumholzibacteriota bacterium]